MKKARVEFDECKLQSEEIRKRYNVEALAYREDSDLKHDKILKYRDAAKKVTGWSITQTKQWIGYIGYENLKIC